MNDSEFIKSLVTSSNESYRAGYQQGLLEGKRQAYAEFQRILGETFPKPKELEPS